MELDPESPVPYYEPGARDAGTGPLYALFTLTAEKNFELRDYVFDRLGWATPPSTGAKTADLMPCLPIQPEPEFVLIGPTNKPTLEEMARPTLEDVLMGRTGFTEADRAQLVVEANQDLSKKVVTTSYFSPELTRPIPTPMDRHEERQATAFVEYLNILYTRDPSIIGTRHTQNNPTICANRKQHARDHLPKQCILEHPEYCSLCFPKTCPLCRNIESIPL